MQFEHKVGHILTPTIFNNMCENYRKKVEGDPIKYPYWKGRSPTFALVKEFKNIGVVDIPKRNMVYLKFLNEDNKEIKIDGFNASHIPFFYFFPLNNQFIGFDSASSWANGYRTREFINQELEKKFQFIKQFFSYKDWEEFSSNLIYMLYAYGQI